MSLDDGGGGPSSPSARTWAGAFSSVLIARILSSGATFLTVIIAARALGRGTYGELVIVLSVMKVAAELVGPALDTTLVRHAARYHDADPQRSLAFIRAVFMLKLMLAAMLVMLCAVVSWPLSRLLSDPASGVEIDPLMIVLAFAGSASTLFWAFAQAVLQSQQKFARYAAIELVCALIRLAAVGALVMGGNTGLTPIVGAYVAAPAVAAWIAWRGLPAGLYCAPKATSAIMGEVLHFGKWVVLACAFTSLAQRADIFLLTGLDLPAEAIGDYGAALQLTLVGDLFILTLFNVLLPKASSLANADELRGFLNQFFLPALLMFAGLVPFLLLSRWIAVLAFGPDYIRAGGLFTVLVLGSAFALGSAPAGAALYGMGRTPAVALLEGLKLAGIVVGGLFLSSAYGLFGMAWAVAAAKGVAGVATYIVALRITRQTATREAI